MPEPADEKWHGHPWKKGSRDQGIKGSRWAGQAGGYAELCCRTNFSFLRGASHPEELVERAVELGYAGLAVTDRNSLAGAVRMHLAAKEHGLKLIVGAEIVPVDGPPMVLLAPTRAAYGRLSRLITVGRRRAVKGDCRMTCEDVSRHAEGIVGILVGTEAGKERDQGIEGSRDQDGGTKARIRPHAVGHEGMEGEKTDAEWVEWFRGVFGTRGYLGASLGYGADDERRLRRRAKLARWHQLPLVATNDVHYHAAERRYLHDVMTCIRHGCTVHEAGRRLLPNGRRHLLEPAEMARLFAAYPEAVARTVEIADRCTFNLDELRYEYPTELSPPATTPMDHLESLTWAGAREHYGKRVPDRVRRMIEHELGLIRELRYESYFLTVWDLVKFARSRGILCQGRGSAANSAVCYCLGVTAVDPARIDLLFERFVSRERNEPPDIDVDFEHERREEVFQYIYEKYGRDRAAIAAEVITYRPRSAVRDVGKALGLSLDCVDVLAKRLDWREQSPMPESVIREAGLDPDNRTLRLLERLVRQLVGFPRHLSQHVGGFVITQGALCESVPIENAAMPDRTFIQWDKDDLDALGMLKVDCLALGMLTAIGKCFELLRGRGVIEGLRDRGIEGSRGYDAEMKDGEQGDVSGACCLAQGDRVGENGLSSYAPHAGCGEIRIDITDAPRGSVGGEQYRRRQRASVDPCRHSWHPREHPRSAPDASEPDVQPAEKARGIKGSEGIKIAEIRESRRGDGRVGREITGVRFSNALESNREHHVNNPVPRSATSIPPIPTSLVDVPAEDPVVYDMICAADTVGVFQIESRAQMSMLPRLRPRRYYDLVIEVAIVRPGPIQGGMVHPYLRRRRGEEPITYPNDAVKDVLGKTLGVPLFQEQVMRLAVVAAGFTPGEADQLRRSMAAWRKSGRLEQFRDKLVEGMKANGYDADFAQRCFEQIRGFGEYGFPESHAASFALLVYVSAWLKRYHPAAFAAAVINSQPMGFYAPAQLVRDAREHGVCVLGVDVNASGFDCRLEGSRDQDEGTEARRHGGTHPAPRSGGRRHGREALRGWDAAANPGWRSADARRWGVGGPALRLGMRLVRGLSREKVKGIEAAQKQRRITSIQALLQRGDVSRDTLMRLAAADAFRSLGLDRRQAVWQVLAARDEPGLFADLEPAEEKPPLPETPLNEQVLHDYGATGLSLKAHPMSLVRQELRAMGVQPNEIMKHARHGQRTKVGGLVLIRQRPGTAKGIVFATIEDETGVANLVIKPPAWKRWGRATVTSIAVIAEGHIEREGQVVHLVVHRMHDLSERLGELQNRSRNFH